MHVGKRSEVVDNRGQTTTSKILSQKCTGCRTSVRRTRKCGDCESAAYCSKECQKVHWNTHKQICCSIKELAKQQERTIATACEVGQRTGKQSKLIKLVGRRVEVSCQIQSRKLKALWDTGAQVSLVSQLWLKANLKPEEYEIQSVNELLEQKLEIEGVGNNKIPFVGYTVLSFQIGSSEEDESIQVPFLVCAERLHQPLIGSNVIEEVVSQLGELGQQRLNKLLMTGLQGCDVAAAKAISEQLLEDDNNSTTVKTLKQKKKTIVPAGACVILKCKIQDIELDQLLHNSSHGMTGTGNIQSFFYRRKSSD